MTLGIVLAYLAIVLSIGLWSQRRASATGEDFFVASRSIGPFVLLMTLFGTHMTAFALLGASAESYRVGIGVYALMASSSALMVPMVYLFVGTRVWRLGQRHGYMTQVQLLNDRFGTPWVGRILFPILVLLLIPYLLIGVLGGGVTLTQITGGQVAPWVGQLLIGGVVLGYVSFGGLRGTAWVNTFQTCFFMVLGGLTLVVILNALGGVANVFDRVEQEAPRLLIRGDAVGRWQLLSYTLIPLSVGMFPHIFLHWLSARRVSTFKAPVVFYPLCIAVVWVPSVLLGIAGHLDLPNLVGPETNSVLVRMIALYAPNVLGGLLAAGVFAAIMSSLDSQSLALGTMFTQDVAAELVPGMSERRQILLGRLFVVAVIVATLVVAQFVTSSIFGLAIWSFTGYAGLFPILLGALFWRRATAAGAIFATLTVALTWIYFFSHGWGNPDYSIGGSGVMPVAAVFGASCLALVVGSLASRPLESAAIGRFFVEPDA